MSHMCLVQVTVHLLSELQNEKHMMKSRVTLTAQSKQSASHLRNKKLVHSFKYAFRTHENIYRKINLFLLFQYACVDKLRKGDLEEEILGKT